MSDEDLKDASIYLDSLLVSVRKNVSCLLVPLFLLHPFKIKLEAASESMALQPGSEGVCWEQQWVGKGWEGAQFKGQGRLVSPSPGGQGNCIRDSAQLGGFEPGWAKIFRKTAQIISREIEAPGNLMPFPSKEQQSVYMQNAADSHGRRTFWAPGAGRNMGFRGRGPGFKSQLCHSVAI